jgi:hypothetical protein
MAIFGEKLSPVAPASSKDDPYGRLLPLPLTSLASLIKGLSYEDMMQLAGSLQKYFNEEPTSNAAAIANNLHLWSKDFLNGKDKAGCLVIDDRNYKPVKRNERVDPAA